MFFHRVAKSASRGSGACTEKILSTSILEAIVCPRAMALDSASILGTTSSVMIECSAAETGMLKKRNLLSAPSSVLGLSRKECARHDGLSQNLSGGMRPFASEVLSALAPTARAPTLLAITEQFMSEGLLAVKPSTELTVDVLRPYRADRVNVREVARVVDDRGVAENLTGKNHVNREDVAM